MVKVNLIAIKMVKVNLIAIKMVKINWIAIKIISEIKFIIINFNYFNQFQF